MTTEEAVIIQECEAKCSQCQYSGSCSTEDSIIQNISMNLEMEEK